MVINKVKKFEAFPSNASTVPKENSKIIHDFLEELALLLKLF